MKGGRDLTPVRPRVLRRRDGSVSTSYTFRYVDLFGSKRRVTRTSYEGALEAWLRVKGLRDRGRLGELERGSTTLERFHDEVWLPEHAPTLTPGTVAHYEILVLMAYAGLRPSEVAALRLADVRDRTLLVHRAVRQGDHAGLKNGSSYRTVELLQPVKDDIATVTAALGTAGGAAETPLIPDAAGQVRDGDDYKNWRRRQFRPSRPRARPVDQASIRPAAHLRLPPHRRPAQHPRDRPPSSATAPR